MAEEEKGEIEVGVSPTGVTGRAKGYRLMDILWILVAGSIGYEAYALAGHQKDSEEGIKAIVKALNEGNEKLVKAVEKQSEKLEKMNDAQTVNQQITNCLLALPPDRRNQQAAELCNRIIRGR